MQKKKKKEDGQLPVELRTGPPPPAEGRREEHGQFPVELRTGPPPPAEGYQDRKTWPAPE